MTAAFDLLIMRKEQIERGFWSSTAILAQGHYLVKNGTCKISVEQIRYVC
jgi:hypothetical protein